MRKRTIILPILALVLAGLFLIPMEGLNFTGDVGLEIHVEMWHYRDGELISYSHHPGVLTTLGQNWIEDQLGDSPATDPAKWIAVSNDAGSPSAAWIVIPSEITTGGMGRAVGTYVDNGDGAWNITKTFSPSASGSCQLTGLYWALAGDFLLCADTFTQVNYEDGDSVTIKWSLSASGS